MSNIGSSAINAATKTGITHHIPPATPGQQAFQRGTMSMLDDARQVIENAVGQGAQLNPLIYQMLGLQPTYADNTADLTTAQNEATAAQQQLQQAQQTLDTIRGIPVGKRSPEQRQQFRQLTKQIPALTRAMGDARNAFDAAQSTAKSITGFSRLDPSQIPASSPFSAQNPLNQAETGYENRLNQYLSGTAAVDPTLVHQYNAAEAQLRTSLAQRFGPDFANTTVGQMALQNFTRQKNEAFATWNQQMVGQYNNLAFGGQANLQSLLGGQINLLREPQQNQMAGAQGISNLGGTRLNEQQIVDQMRLGLGGTSINTTQNSPSGDVRALAGGVGSALTTPYNQQGDTLGGLFTGGNAAQPTSVNVPVYPSADAQAAAAAASGSEAAGATGAGASLAGDYGASAATDTGIGALV